MSSEATTVSQGRCRFCSLACATAVEPFGPDRLRPAYPQGAPSGCARGQMIGDLLGHLQRLHEPRATGPDGWRPLAMGEALRRAAGLGADGRAVHVWLDGNLPARRLERAALAARRWRPHCELAVYVPPADREAVAGLEAAGVESAELDRLDGADAYLVFGDPFVTHPVISGAMLQRRREAPRMPWVVVDSAAGVTAGFATHPLLTAPGEEGEVAAALAAEFGHSGARSSERGEARVAARPDVRGAVAALRDKTRPAVIFAPQTGRATTWSSAAESLGRLASALSAPLVLLTTFPEPAQVLRTAGQLGCRDMGDAIERLSRGQNADVLLVGLDLSDLLPRRLWDAALGRAREVVAAVPFAAGLADVANLLVPLAMPFEEPEGADGLFGPPAGVLMPEALLEELADLAERGSAASGLAGGITGREPGFTDQPARSGGEDQAALDAVLMADATHFDAGGITRQTSWARVRGLHPRVLLSPADAARLVVRDGGWVEVRNDHGAAVCRVVVRPAQPAGQVAISAAYPAARGLADWRVQDGFLRCGPFRVVLQAAGVPDDLGVEI